MRRTECIAMWCAMAVVVLASHGTTWAADPNAPSEQSITCDNVYNFGAGATAWSICISRHGNVISMICPGGQEHVRIGTFREGYILRDNFAGTTFWDTGASEAGFGAPVIVQPNGANTFPLTICRVTTDGNWRLCTQAFVKNNAEKEVKFTMRLTNLSGLARSANLCRYADFDVDNTVPGDIFDRSTDSVWARERNGMKLSALSYTVPHRTIVGTCCGGDDACSNEVSVATPTAAGDFDAKLQYLLGVIGSGISRVVTVKYECL